MHNFQEFCRKSLIATLLSMSTCVTNLLVFMRHALLSKKVFYFRLFLLYTAVSHLTSPSLMFHNSFQPWLHNRRSCETVRIKNIIILTFPYNAGKNWRLLRSTAAVFKVSVKMMFKICDEEIVYSTREYLSQIT